MKNIPDCSIDCVITDPPYGTTACKWDAVIPFEPMWAELKRIIKPNGAIVLFGSEPFSSLLRVSNLKMYKYDWVWEKSKASNFLQARTKPLKAHENIHIFSIGSCVYFPQMKSGNPYDKGNRKNSDGIVTEVYNKVPNAGKRIVNSDGKRFPRSVQYFRTAESEGKFSPTQKPVALIEYLIRTYTNEGDKVLDFTMGSGTTGVACKNLNRNFIGIEMDDGYYNIAKKRINETELFRNETEV